MRGLRERQDEQSSRIYLEAKLEGCEELSAARGYEVCPEEDPVAVDLLTLSLLGQALDKARAEYEQHRWMQEA